MSAPVTPAIPDPRVGLAASTPPTARPAAPAAPAVRPRLDLSWLDGLFAAPLAVTVGLVAFIVARLVLGFLLGSPGGAFAAMLVGLGAGGGVFWVVLARPWRRWQLPPRR